MNRDTQQWVGITLFLLVIIPGLIYAAAELIDEMEAPTLRADHCLSDTPESIRAILFDVSDKPSMRQQEDIATWFSERLRELAFDERLLVYVLNEHLRGLPTPVFSGCRPQLKPEEFPTHATEAFLHTEAMPWFAERQKDLEQWLSQKSPSKASPIFEYLIAMARNKQTVTVPHRQLYIVSDTLQNTHYDPPSDPLFEGMVVRIIRLERRGLRKRQDASERLLKDFLLRHGAKEVRRDVTL